MLETGAEVLGGLRQAFLDYEEGFEEGPCNDRLKEERAMSRPIETDDDTLLDAADRVLMTEGPSAFILPRPPMLRGSQLRR